MKRYRIFLLLFLFITIKSFALQTTIKVQVNHFTDEEVQLISIDGDDVKLNREAHDSLFNRYGREDYAKLKEEIFRLLPNMQYPGSIVAAAEIFNTAKDFEAFLRLLNELDPRQIPDDYSWHSIAYILDLQKNDQQFQKNDQLLEAFLLKCPCPDVWRRTPYFSGSYFDLMKKRMEKPRNQLEPEEEAALSRQITAVKKQMETNIECCLYNEYLLPDTTRRCVERMNAFLAQEKNGAKRMPVVRKLDRFFTILLNRRHQPTIKKYEKDMREFADQLNKENIVEFLPYIQICQKNKWCKELVPYLEEWQDKKVTEEELKEFTRFFSRPFNHGEGDSIVLNFRHNTLISALMESGKAEEAQKLAEKYYGQDVDAHSISSQDLRFLGTVQASSGANFFKKKLEKPTPQPQEGLPYYTQRIQYYYGRLSHYTTEIAKRNVPIGQTISENARQEQEEFHKKQQEDIDNILKLCEEAIQAGLKNNDHELYLWGMTVKIDNLLRWKRPLDDKTVLAYAREAYDYAVEHVTLEMAEKNKNLSYSRDGAALQYLRIMDAQVRGNRNKFFINGQNQVQPDATDAWDKYVKQMEAEQDRVFRRELKDGFYGTHYFFFESSYPHCSIANYSHSLPFNTTFASDDEIFQNILDPSFMAKHAPHHEFDDAPLHRIRLLTVPLKPTTGEGFEVCLKQAIDYFNKAMDLTEKRGYPHPMELPDWLGSIHFQDCVDAEAKNAIISKYIYDHYPKRRYMVFEGLAATIPARSYEEGKQLLEEAWQKHEMQSRHRQKGLRFLLEKAPSDAEREWCKAELKKLNVNVE